MKELTKAEEQVMKILWQIEKGFVNNILDFIPEPKPAYNTISTIIRILEQKGFVSHIAYGKTHEYFPLISKNDYRKSSVTKLVTGYFGSSYKELVSFFAKEEKLNIKELEELKKTLEDSIRNKKGE